jgi:hypothetical protein
MRTIALVAPWSFMIDTPVLANEPAARAAATLGKYSLALTQINEPTIKPRNCASALR